MPRRWRPWLIPPGGPPAFPDPDISDDEGLVAVGGDLSVIRLLTAYDHGIFPWYEAKLPPLWWSPNPRGILEPHRLHISRGMRRVLRQGRFEVTFDEAFSDVMAGCAHRPGAGTWLIPEMMGAYLELHHQGFAHSFEVWQGQSLVGGLYGVQRGALFAAESMFHRETNASKVALIVAVQSLFGQGIELFDVQFLTSHLASMGARTIPRREYLARVAVARTAMVCLEGLRSTLLMKIYS